MCGDLEPIGCESVKLQVHSALMARQTAEFRQWALAGAQVAIERLQSEILRIRAAFPELGGHETRNGRRRGRPRKASGAEAGQTDAENPFPKRRTRVQSAEAGSRRPKRTMSPEARKESAMPNAQDGPSRGRAAQRNARPPIKLLAFSRGR